MPIPCAAHLPAPPLEGRFALVAGVTGAVGEASVMALARAGADVLLAVSESGAGRVDHLIDAVASMGRQARHVIVDDDVERSISAIDAAGEGRVVDILLDACDARVDSDALVIQRRDLDRIMYRQVVSPYLLCQHVASRLVSSGQVGSIVMLAGSATPEGAGRDSMRCMTDAARRRMVQCLAGEWRRYGIRVNAVCPTRAAADAVVGDVGTGSTRRGTETDAIDAVVAAVLWLSSPAADSVSGLDLRVDGGGGLRVDGGGE